MEGSATTTQSFSYFTAQSISVHAMCSSMCLAFLLPPIVVNANDKMLMNTQVRVVWVWRGSCWHTPYPRGNGPHSRLHFKLALASSMQLSLFVQCSCFHFHLALVAVKSLPGFIRNLKHYELNSPLATKCIQRKYINFDVLWNRENIVKLSQSRHAALQIQSGCTVTCTSSLW